MQTDNNLVLYDNLGNPLWSSNTMSSSYTGSYLLLQDDGNAVIYDSKNISRWSTNTGQSKYYINIILISYV